MSDRRTVLLDGAITVLGERGVRALTHRAADAEAGFPIGSASNHFRTRDALLDAVVVRIAEREQGTWEQLARQGAPRTPDDLAAMLAELAREATTTHRTLVLARYALLVEAGCHESRRRQLRATGARVSGWFMECLSELGSTDAGLDGHLIMNYWTGLVLHELAMPAGSFEPHEPLTALLRAVLPARAVSAYSGGE